MSENNTPSAAAQEEARTNELTRHIADLLYAPQSLTAQVLDHSRLRIAYVPGVMPGKWFTRWHERYGDRAPLAEIPVGEGMGLQALTTEYPAADAPHSMEPFAHMAIVRPGHEPQSAHHDEYHSIHLYDEAPVLIMPSEHVLTVLDEVSFEDLAEEFLLHDPAEYPAWDEASRVWRAANPRFLPDISSDREAIELAAAGVGLYIAPMSVARFYHRKDLTYRPMHGIEPYPVTLTWRRTPAAHPRPEHEETLIQDFIGIVRGRTASSERGSETKQSRRVRIAQEKAKTKAKNRAANARRESQDKKKANARKNGSLRQHTRRSTHTARAKRAGKKH